MKKKITAVVLLLGRYEMQVQQLEACLGALPDIQNRADVILVADHPQWSSAPAIQVFLNMNPDIRFFLCPQSVALPANAMNLGISHVETEYMFFALLEDPISDKLDRFLEALEEKTISGRDQGEEGIKSFFITPSIYENHQTYKPEPQNIYGWVQSAPMVPALSSYCVSRKLFETCGEIDENPLLYTEIERWFGMYAAKYSSMADAGMEQKSVKRLYEYPLRNEMRTPSDLSVRYAIYSIGIAAEERDGHTCARGFAEDLNEEEAKIYERWTGIKAQGRTRLHKHFKILILGGYWEYHHNQICFFNYLEKLYGQGFATFRSALEYTFPPHLALDYDLVIFTRCRSRNALDILCLCKDKSIPTMYMIDDNWLSIAEDHPKIGAMFVPGNEDYDNFVKALGLCKAVWLFNDVLREDVLPYSSCVKKFQVSVDEQTFTVPEPRQRTDNSLYVGFSGSLRWDDTAFKALARYARRHKNVRVILIGVLSEKQEALFNNIDVIRIGFESYKQYARSIGALQPDLFLAPLADNRTENSKCVNKYIESGVVGTVCIYSKVLPYTTVVEDGVNGFFVEEETAEGWYRTLEKVLSDVGKLREVQKNAYEDVKKNYTTNAVLYAFVEKLTSVIEEEDMRDD